MYNTRFTGDLIIRALTKEELKERHSRRQLFELKLPFIFHSRFGDIVIPSGFISDFASVPSLTKWLIDDDDPDLLFASIPHDYLYHTKGLLLGGIKLTRLEADKIIVDAMEACGAPKWKRWVVYMAVRIGGRAFWRV